MRRKGFTLIEVLIVVIILGILATLALPQFTKMRKRAYLAEAWAGLGAIRTAQAIYYMEHLTYGADGSLDYDIPGASAQFSYAVVSNNDSDFRADANGNTTGPANGVNAWITTNTNGYCIN